MKVIIAGVVLAVVMGLAIQNRDSIFGQDANLVYVKEAMEVVKEEVKVDVVEERIAKAKAEAMTEIEAQANSMRDKFVANELDKVEAKVLAEIQQELKARQIEAEKRSGEY
jgi:hypothetical protein